jgi:ATP-dependent helicase/nuclease subunit B
LRLTSDALREDLFGTARLLASLRGRVTLSFPSFDVIEAKPSFPASVVLQAWRLIQGDASLDYSRLLFSLPKPKGLLPDGTAEALDDTDWWLAKVRPGSDVDAFDTVLRNFPDIASGVRAAAIRAGHKVSPYEGRIKVRPEDLHPALNADIVMSASRIEKLAACPFGYFLRYVLGISPPDDIEYNPSCWLDAAQRGRLIHDILCGFMTRVRDAREEVDPRRHAGLLKEIAETSVSRFRDEVPPPSEGIFEKERAELLRTIEVFLNAEAGRIGSVDPLLFEVSFGTGAKDGEGFEEPVEVELGGGRTFRLKGRIDRIDRIGKGAYRVIDYKTGKIRDHEALENARNCFGQGKILQHALYAVAAERILKAKGLDRAPRVVESGYSFPTRQGEGKEVFVRDLDRKRLREVLTLLFDVFQTGNFVANPDASCDFCDLAAACGGGAKTAKGKEDENPGEFGIFEKLKDYS